MSARNGPVQPYCAHMGLPYPERVQKKQSVAVYTHRATPSRDSVEIKRPYEAGTQSSIAQTQLRQQIIKATGHNTHAPGNPALTREVPPGSEGK